MHARFSQVSLLLILIILFSSPAFCEDDDEPEYTTEIVGWKIASVLTGGIHITEHEDWQAGGSDTVAINGRFDFWAIRQTKRFDWKNRLKLEYGVTRTDGEDYRSSSDVILLDTRFEYKFNPRFFAYARGYLNTHMGNQYDYYDDPVDIIFFDKQVEQQVTRTKVSDGIDPLELEQGLGLGWTIYKNADASTAFVFMAGAGTRQLLSDSYYIEDDNPITPELEYQQVEDYDEVGVEGVVDITWKITDLAQFTTHGAAFYGFDRELWKNRLESALNLKITEVIGVSMSAEMIYDEAIFDGVQWKLGTMLTFSYKMF